MSDSGQENQIKNKKALPKKFLLYVIAIIITLVAGAGSVYGYQYLSTPANIRQPAFEHYHIRTQVIVDGKSVDFSGKKFQENYDKGSCTQDLGDKPIDFHDSVDQMTHVHWKGVTGGQFLKYYGWNLVGGANDTLGNRYDKGFMPMQSVERFGDLLPEVSKDSNYYVYIGDKNGYEKKNWDDFLSQDMETFFDKKSYIGDTEEISKPNLLDLISPKVQAHGGENDKHAKPGGEDLSETELTRINNLLGNVVIFAQKEEPTKKQIQDKFNNLIPLSNSTCGG